MKIPKEAYLEFKRLGHSNDSILNLTACGGRTKDEKKAYHRWLLRKRKENRTQREIYLHGLNNLRSLLPFTPVSDLILILKYAAESRPTFVLP